MSLQYASANKIKKELSIDISNQTFRRWEAQGLIRCHRMHGGSRLYCTEDIRKIFDLERSDRGKICYARVSSNHQKEDLQRQIDFLKERYPEHEIISDIGSGLNFKRKGFLTLLERVYEGNISEVVVLYKDRLCRFGFELLEFIFEKAGTKLLVFSSKDEDKPSDTEELSEDLLGVITFFVARNNGLQSGRNKARRAEKIGESKRDES